VRVLNCAGSGSFAQVIAGVDWVTGNHSGSSPAVANMSLGGGYYQPLIDAVTASIADGVTYALAAGNSNADACGFSPAATPNALTAGATTNTDARASFSNYGSCLDLFAPGVNITSAWNSSDLATNTISGTSMASPHVAGAAALYLGANPGATPAQVASALTNNATQNAVSNPGTGSPNRLLYTGSGGGSPPSTNLPPTAGFTSSCSHRNCTFTSTASDPENALAAWSWTFGDGASTSGTQAQVSHTYAKQGNYTITHTVTDAVGQTASAQKTLRVKR